MLPTHSIFARQWWAVALQTTRGITGAAPIERLEEVATEIAKGVGGGIHKTAGLVRRGVFISAASDQLDPAPDIGAARAMLILQTEKVYFPLAEEDLELGTIGADSSQTSGRDFPRRLVGGDRTVYQYPLFIAFSQRHAAGGLYVITCPYYLLLRDIMNGLERGSSFSDCMRVDVARVFETLTGAKLTNGTVTVRAGRMLITGIDFIRSAVFFGDNVIASSLYTNLVDDAGVTLNLKDCRLQRSYEDPVGGSRRAHVCWFDPHGNFRFTPGSNGDATIKKFIELLNALAVLGLVEKAATKNPLKRVGARSSS